MSANKNQIITSDQPVDIEHHFKVIAGPGAGKTYWLITHIKNVLHNSKRLGKAGKLACITYTNQGVKEIQDRLGGVAGRVEVATIHSFLYKNVLRPHAFLFVDDEGKHLINLRELDGHDEHIPSRDKIHRWVVETKQGQLERQDVYDAVYDALSDLDWHLENGNLLLLPRHRWKIKVSDRFSIRKDSLPQYKTTYWRTGQIHHEDVLYFSYRLIIEHPKILEFLRAKFLYIFIDEFQDTHPLQTAIIKEVAKDRTVVGVIGDPAQSIFAFMGAKRSDFLEFNLNGLENYVIENNRRSTEKIIQILNNLRKDLQQKSIREEGGDIPQLILGEKIKAIEYVHKHEPIVLARNNTTVNELKTDSRSDTLIWDSYREVDSNAYRVNFLYVVLCAVENVIAKDYHEALRLARKLFRKRLDGSHFSNHEKKNNAVQFLDYLSSQRAKHSEMTIQEFNNELHQYMLQTFNVKEGAEIKRGKIAEFTSSHLCKDLASEIRLKDESANIRTIHKAKGAEFETILLVLENEKQLDQLLQAELDEENDESRVYYVALSRAKDRLFISIPSINDANQDKLRELGFDIVVLEGEEKNQECLQPSPG